MRQAGESGPRGASLAVCSVWRLVFRSPEFAPEFGPSYPSCGKELLLCVL